jgi:hypothetical protein
VLDGARTLDEKAVDALIAEASERAPNERDAAKKSRVVIKMVAAKRRPRRPAR